MSVGVVDRATVLGELQAFMRSKGLEVEEVDDLDEVREIIEAAEKPYLTPMSSPGHNDFTQRNVLWLVARRDGDPVYLGCARLEDIGSEDLGRFWGRVFKRAYGGGSENKIRGFGRASPQQ